MSPAGSSPPPSSPLPSLVPGSVRRSTGDRLDAATLYALLRLRVDVFVVEQACPYPELDGRDLDPATVHLWLVAPSRCVPPASGRPGSDHAAGAAGTGEEQAGDGAVLGCVRLLDEGGRRRVGRVCTARWARGRGVAAELMRAVLVELGDTPSVLNAQSHLAGFYAAFGYRPDGEEFVEDSIPHLPMLRTGADPTS
jgi:ElaA protein